MSKDARREDQEDLHQHFALQIDDSLLNDALEAVERRLYSKDPEEEALGISLDEPGDPPVEGAVDQEIELDLDLDGLGEPLGEPPPTAEDPAQAAPTIAGPSGAEFEALRAELEALRAETGALRAENEALQAESEAAQLASDQALVEARQETAAAKAKLNETVQKAARVIQKARRKEGLLNQIRAEKDVLQEQVDEWRPLLLEYRERLHAMEDERIRLRSRQAREMEEVQLYGTERILKSLLPVLDNMDMALDHEAHADRLREGLQMIHSQLQSGLRRNGLKRLESAPGDLFDPERHDAIGNAPSAAHPADHLLEIVQPAYALSGRLIRAARVIVSSGPGPLEPEPETGAPPADAGPESAEE